MTRRCKMGHLQTKPPGCHAGGYAIMSLSETRLALSLYHAADTSTGRQTSVGVPAKVSPLEGPCFQSPANPAGLNFVAADPSWATSNAGSPTGDAAEGRSDAGKARIWLRLSFCADVLPEPKTGPQDGFPFPARGEVCLRSARVSLSVPQAEQASFDPQKCPIHFSFRRSAETWNVC